jgi:hypothetical protein
MSKPEADPTMKKNSWIAVIGVILALAGLAAPAGASSCAQIDISGAKSTGPSGINPRGDIVGQFTDATNVIHGFLIDHRTGQVAVIDPPGSTRTTGVGISARGDIVGRYDNPTSAHGYLLSQGQFTTLQFPGSTFSTGMGINARGDIVGNYRVGTALHAYSLVGGVYSNIDVPGATATSVSGIDESGDVSGNYVTSDGVTHGFIVRGSLLITADAPGAIFTYVRGITAGGHLAMGSYSADKNLVLLHGFLYEDGKWTSFDYPGAATTTVIGVNSRGDFVGDFNTDAGNLFHGYVCRSTVDGVFPVAASAPAAFNTSFKTSIKLHNPYESPISGTLIFRRQAVPGSSADPTLNYTLAPYETRDYPDLLSAMGQTGLGSIDLIATTSLVPVATARVYNDRDPMGIGAHENLIGPELAILPGESGTLLAPDDLQRYRFNIGVRTLAAGASMTVSLRDRAGVLRKSFTVAYPGDFFFQLSADAFLGLPLQPGDSIRFAVTSGRAVVYGATADNTTQQSAISMSTRSVD